CGAAFLITHAFLVVSLLRRRQGDAKRASVKVEVFWGVAATFGLLLLFVTSERAWTRLLKPTALATPGAEPQRLLVIGEQFKWSVIEPGADNMPGRYLIYPQPTDDAWPNPGIVDAATAAEPPAFDFYGVPG